MGNNIIDSLDMKCWWCSGAAGISGKRHWNGYRA